MKSYAQVFWRLFVSTSLVLAWFSSLPGLVNASSISAPDRVQSVIVLDGLRDSDYAPFASDPAGDLGAPSSWEGTLWADLTALYVAADAANLYVYVDLPVYTYTVSTGQIGLALDVDGKLNSGGASDPWANAITFDGRNVDGAATPGQMLPDYVIRGNLPADGWTELRAWDNGSWTGSGVNWGGIASNSQIGTHVAYAQGNGVEFAIPLADIGNPDPAQVHLQFFTTQGGGTKGAYDTLPSDNQSAGWDEATSQHNLVSVPVAVDPPADLASPGPADWNGVTWTDQTRLHIWADHDSLHLYLPMPAYDTSVSTGQIGLAIDTKPGGGNGDPWGNAITSAYTTTFQNLGHSPLLTTTVLLPDYYIRGNVYGPSDNGWTELRTWNGSDWNTGGGVDWGGIGNSGQPSVSGSKVSWTNQDGLRLRIPFSDLNIAAGDTIHLQFYGTQTGGAKGAYDTVPSDDQSTGWDDATTQKVFSSYVVPDIPSGGATHDNNVWWGDLGHDSRDSLYRTPAGPVPTNTPVTLRLRAASGDLTAAKVRIYNDRLNTEFFLNMNLAADDGQYEWWQAVVPASALTTVYWYRFIAIDGTATAYYEDDASRDGGWGEARGASADYSWQLTVYDPAFATPDWVKNAVIYQIFPDRFRDGDPGNDTATGSFFYDESGGTIYRSEQADWNQAVCDPRSPTECPGKYSSNFYGGDLQGLIDKLDYLQNLGVTAIYLNPIFESPSNHKYDTTDYHEIDDNFGSTSLFVSLVTAAHNRGMHIILDGVFNHTSSDSVYFDRYGRYTQVGACESPTSPYRDWYFFTDVAPGTGTCAGSDGTPDAATYESWFGYDSLPKLDSSNPQVRNLIWANGTGSIAPYWMQWADGWRLDVGGDVDPGTLNDPANNFWEGFRAAVHAANPDAYIVGEEWGNASSWVLGGEWDATMNYQYGSAMLSFWRDTPFTDNDHNTGSSAGVLAPLTPSQLENRLRNWQERYPPEAYYAMMNLLDSHDTNRALFLLDQNAAVGTDDTLLDNPNYDWSGAITRLKGVVLLQMTLPGAPTIYYGDEVGLVGPVTYDGSSWQDDPYNRQPYPWLDESGTPFYNHLQTSTVPDDLRAYYTELTAARNSHPALRTGSFDSLLVDDANDVLAYGRRMDDLSDAAVVIANRGSTITTVSLDLAGYLPYGTVLSNVLDGGALYTVDGNGQLSLDVPGMSGAVLVLSGSLNAPPQAVSDLAVTAERSGEIDLAWSAAVGAASYDVYRSLLTGGGYALITNTASITYTDTNLMNGISYYYVVVSRADGNGLVSGYSNEATGIPHLLIDWANTQWPPEITHTIGITPTENIYGQVYINGATSVAGPTPGLLAQVGFGITGTLPANWTDWSAANFNADAGNNDEFTGQLVPEATGEYQYLYRYSTTGGRDWFYADLSGPIDPAQMAVNPGKLHVLAATDTTPPDAPQHLQVVDWSSSSISLAWDPVTGDPGLYAYDIFRSEISGTVGTKVGRVLAPTVSYTDTQVTTGTTYYYLVQALDVHFNRSGYSNQVPATAEPKVVAVTFRVAVPDFTPGTVYIAGNIPGIPQWNPGATPMTEISPNLWEFTIDIPDGLSVEYKYTRSTWDMVEWWGSITDLNNRHLTVAYGASGTQLVDDTATDWGSGPDDHKAVRDWRDPIVIAHSPGANAADVPLDSPIQVTWNHTMTVSTAFDVDGTSGPVAGSFGHTTDLQTFVFTPTVALLAGSPYTVTVSGQIDQKGITQQVPVQWNFDSVPIELAFSDSAYSAGEADGAATIVVALSAPVGITVTVDYASSDGTAVAGVDYQSISGTLTFAPGDTHQTFEVPIIDNDQIDGNRTVNLSLSNPAGASLGAPAMAVLTIVDDELPLTRWYFPFVPYMAEP